MLVQSTIAGVSKIVHDGVEFAVEKGYALVSDVVGNHLISFPEWNQVTEEVDPKIVSKLEKAEPKIQVPIESQAE